MDQNQTGQDPTKQPQQQVISQTPEQTQEVPAQVPAATEMAPTQGATTTPTQGAMTTKSAEFMDHIPNSITQSAENSVYDKDELEAGGDLDSINPSKIFAHRMSITAGETGRYAIKRQTDDKIIYDTEAFNGIILHGHRVYKLYQWMIDGLHDDPDFDKTRLTQDQSQVLAISYDNPKKSRGSYDIAGHGAYLDNPKLFSTLKRYSRLFLYILVPGLTESDTGASVGIVYSSLPVSASNAYNALILQKQSKSLVLPYRLTTFSLLDATSEKGDKYKKAVFALGDEYCSDIKVLRQRIKPLFMQVRDLHKNLVENTEIGNIIKEAEPDEKVIPFSDDIPF